MYSKNKFFKITFFLLLIASAMNGNAQRTLYVEYSSNTVYDGTEAKPYPNLFRANEAAQAGDTFLIKDTGGAYVNSTGTPILNITKSGTVSQPIIFKNYPGHTPIIQTSDSHWQGIFINGSYVTIDGLTVKGRSASQTLTAALGQGKSCTNPTGSLEAKYNTNGIQVDGRVSGNNPTGVKYHHITIKNCTVYECGGSGIQILQADYITIENNKCYNNAWYSIYAPSGISIYQPYRFDELTITKIIVRNNICYGNRMYVPWPTASCKFTDGNGIIIDDTKHTQAGSTLGSYTGRTLVANNIVYNNGGSGIHSFASEHVDIINNTAYLNSQTPEIDNGEIFPQDSNDVKIFNNILVAASDQKINSNLDNETNYYDYNLHFGGNSTALTGVNPIIGDPKFSNAAGADFRLQETSPAINAGIATFNGVAAPTTDFINGTRPIGSGYDIGAYEYPLVVITPPAPVLPQFTPGNLVVSLHDAGTGNVITTGGTHRTVYLQEYKTDGAKVNAALALTNFITDERRIAHEAQMQLSANNKYLILAGRSGSETTDFNIARQTNGAAIYRILNDKSIGSTIFTGGSSGGGVGFNNVGIRNVASANGATLYATTGTTTTGTRTVTYGTTSSTAQYDAVANRYIGIYGSDIITVDGSNPAGIRINGTLITKPTGPSYDGVVSAVLFDVNSSEPGNDLMYLAQRNSGIIKLYKSVGTWLITGPTGTYNNGSFNGPVSIVGRIENNKATLYGIKIDPTAPNAASQLIKVVDNVAANLDWNTSGQFASYSVLATSASNITFRGVSFTPCDYWWTGTTSTDFNEPTNWKAGVVPPTGATIYVPNSLTNYPVVSNNFSINTSVIESGTTLKVNSGNLTVAGAIINNGTITIESNANLIQTANTNTNSGTGTAIVKRNSNTLKRLDYTLWSSPVTGTQTLAGFSPLTSLNRFYEYTEGTDQYTAVPSSGTFAAAKGFLIRMPNEGSANYNSGTETLTYAGVFTGVLNNGNIPVTLTKGLNGYIAVGNPYPSVIDANTLISLNSTHIESTLYFWRKTNGSGTAYAAYNLAGGTLTYASTTSEVPNGKIQVGQGFFVKAKNNINVPDFFTNAMRDILPTSTQFFKTKQVVQKDRVWLNLTNTSGLFSQALVGYFADATEGLDIYDGKYINDSAIALTSNINNEEYTIQGRPAFDSTDVVALNFKTDVASEYTIAIDHSDGVFATEQDVYLVDSKTGIETNLKEGAYNFTATAGVDNTRFSLKYQKTLKVGAPAFNENSVSVYINNGTIYVNSGSVAINTIEVYDVQGRLLAAQKNVKATTATINNLKAINQVLIVKITSEDKSVVSKKVVTH
jgi:Right handed beta helix region